MLEIKSHKTVSGPEGKMVVHITVSQDGKDVTAAVHKSLGKGELVDGVLAIPSNLIKLVKRFGGEEEVQAPQAPQEPDQPDTEEEDVAITLEAPQEEETTEEAPAEEKPKAKRGRKPKESK